MKKTLRRSIAATAAGAVVAAGSVAFTAPTAVGADGAGEPAAKLVRSKFGYAAYSFGSQVIVDGIEPAALRTGASELKCTQFAGRTDEDTVLPDQLEELIPAELKEVIDVGLLKTRNESFRAQNGKVHGTRGIADLASISIGGNAIPGLSLPKLRINALTSTALATHTAGKGFAHSEDFSIGGITLEPADEGVFAEDSPVGILFDVVQQVNDGLKPVTDVVDTLLDLTNQVGAIEIPGLGSIALRGAKGRTYKTGAVSEAYSLDITVDPDGAKGTDFAPTRLRLGRAFTRIGGPVFSNVFRSTSLPFSLKVLNQDSLKFSTAGPKSIPCEGTDGKRVTQKFPNSFLLTALGVVGVKDAKAVFSGKQFRRGKMVRGKWTNRPWAKGSMKTVIGEVSIPFADISIKNLVTTLGVNTQKPVTRKGQTTMVRYVGRRADEVVLGGVAHRLPAVGEVIEFAFSGGTGYLEGLKLGNGFFGRSVKPLKLTLLSDTTEDVLEMVIGEANANILPNG